MPACKSGSRWLLAGAAAAGLCAALAPLLAQPPLIRVNVNLVRVVATVRNQSGSLVSSLQKDDFDVYDNGMRQDLAVFERQTDQPLSVALMIDTSASAGIDLKYETDSASKFLHSLLTEGNPRDAVALFGFNGEVQEVSGFTHDYAALEARFHYLTAQGATALYDAILLGSRELERRQGRKAMIIVTDGDDTFSKTTSQEALEAAQLADATIYPVVVVPISNDAGRNIGGEHVLKFMADGTGGRTFLPTLGAELDKAFADIVMELRTQYMLAFYPHGVPPTTNRFHKLEVRLKQPDLRVSARNGYYGEVEAEDSPDTGGVSSQTNRKVPSKPAKKP
ncbi:MAG TPA: VWA domain-containing protein [Bryobacteraceae bacterium]|nr:VWA domain-containing protein [Bryobacteraceae bacterium]